MRKAQKSSNSATNRVAIYIRVSTERDSQKNSLENQESYLTHIAVSNGWEVYKVYTDDGISGARIMNRSGLQCLMADARKKKFNIVLAKSVSRLGRNTIECLKTAFEIESELSIRLVLPEDNHDTLTNTSRLNFQLRAILAEEESAKMATRIKHGYRASAQRGKLNASRPPFGYKAENGALVLHEVYSPIVRDIFNLYLYEGWGFFKIKSYLTDKGIPTPRTVTGFKNAGKLWHESSIRLILENPSYTGNSYFHREETVDFITKKRRQVEPERQIVLENTHPAIITMDEHLAVLKRISAKGANKSNGQESLFAHIAVCADCGHGMLHRKDRGDKANGGAYVCGGYVKNTSKYCSSHLINTHELLIIVKNDLQELITNHIKLEKAYKAACGLVESAQDKHSAQLKRVLRRLAQLQNEFQKLFQAYSQNVISLEQFQKQNTLIIAEQNSLNQQKADLDKQIGEQFDMDEKLKDFKKQLNKIARLDIENEQVLKVVIHKLVQKVEISRDGSVQKIHYNFMNPLSEGA
ncbi:recombinase family protein [Paenibacillus harenae]|uniref:DNA invertase Pin-like site-specific DNA recombinase n=1 Tax=Paenibacillus harenae TaxID=306543 RepID=A0ABT9TYZ9_PAEHA|nr:recombinase family protein [Paenibacillus harenae]MDQ0112533.1 DNA invertase Pin-like site-specific DNA recombinase [Paenibacillus harenae]